MFNIKIKITLVVAGLLLLLESVQLITGWYNLQHQFNTTISTQVQNLIQQKAIILSSQLRNPSATTNITSTVSGIKDLIKEVSSVEVLGPLGNIIASTAEVYNNRTILKQLSKYLKSPKLSVNIINSNTHRYFVNPIINGNGGPIAYLVIALSQKKISATIWNIFSQTLWIAILLYILIITGVYFAVFLITKPISKLLNHTKQVGNGDLTHTAKIYSTDEFGILTHAFNDTTIKLKDVILKIRDVAKEVVGVSSSLSDTYNNLEKASSREISGLKTAFSAISSTITSIEDVANTMEGIVIQYSDLTSALNQFTASIGEVDNSAKGLAVSIGDISISIEEIISSIKEVSSNVEELSKYIEESNSSIHEIRSSTKEISDYSTNNSNLTESVVNESTDGLKSAAVAIEGIGKIKQTTDNIVASIGLLVKNSNQIAEVLDSINQIADKTNLLSLNAAIIANQAGEHGKGFAVVAQGINELAEKTRISTTEIDKIIKNINSEMQKSKLAADVAIKAVEEGVNLTKVTHEKLTIINESTKNTHNVTMSIEKMIREQTIAINTIAEAQEMVSKVSKQILAAVNDQVGGTSQINRAVEGIKVLTNKLHTTTSEQTKSIRFIAKNAENTMHSITNVNHTLNTQKQENNTAVETIENSTKNIEENIVTIKQTEELLSKLKEQLAYLRNSVEWFKLE